MQFQLLRLVLLRRTQPDMFEERGPDGTEITREKWLRRIFTGNIEYQHRGSECHFVPAEDFDEAPFIVGRMGRKRKIDENEPPSSGLKETSRDTWKAAIVLIDPRHHDDGQKIAMEIDAQIGDPFALFSSLAEHINSRSTSEPYYLEVNPITDPNDFWSFELENRGEITSISFGLLAPNMFGIRDDFDKEMRALRDNERAQKAKLDLYNKDGLQLNTERVRQTVGYTLEGGGTVKAKSKKGRRFDSTKRASKKTIQTELPSDEEPPSFLTKAKRAISGIFKS